MLIQNSQLSMQVLFIKMQFQKIYNVTLTKLIKNKDENYLVIVNLLKDVAHGLVYILLDQITLHP